ncbi:16S rRNA (uracil(1498)-N(3))-methyltransferase [bacterium]|nr:16S rRNA (uracil(1498)-N(3))-methyltransferase [bacterium]
MNLLLLEDDDFLAADQARLDGRRARHVRAVHRAAVGDRLRVGRLDGGIGTAIVAALDDEALVLSAIRLDAAPPAPAAVRLLLALPRPKALRRVLQGAAAFGVKDIVLLNTWRVEKSFWESPALAPAALREQVVLGLEQGGDTVLPRIALRRRFKPFVEDELPGLLAGSLGLVAHPPAASACPRGVATHVTLAIGPEGGFIPYEIEALTRAGCVAVSLGPRPLRVEQAVPALLGRLL